eukprot:8899382-Pyramimonas_sp.AAC.1
MVWILRIALNVQLLGCNLWSCTSIVSSHIKEFALNLVSANGACLHACMDLFVRSFAPPIGMSAAAPTTHTGDASSDTPDPVAIRKVCALAPLWPIASAHVTHGICIRHLRHSHPFHTVSRTRERLHNVLRNMRTHAPTYACS